MHHMHSERVWVGQQVVDAISSARRAGRRIIAVGTTVVRALESAALGDSIAPLAGQTDLFIYPGFEFKVVDAMITNFHLPRSSLLMLVSAFAGTERVRQAYAHAIRQRYRFFSYGDAMLLEKKSAGE
jgi:S-adenosylmethionine:tRNA ribosyltransferase-isomerase